MTRFPFGIPDGWFPVAYSDELAPGEVRRIHATSIVSSSRSVPTTGARRCSTPTALISAPTSASAVASSAETHRCPFHGWRFDASGACVEVPVRPEIPAGARRALGRSSSATGSCSFGTTPKGTRRDFEIPAFPSGRARLDDAATSDALAGANPPARGRGERGRLGALPARARHDHAAREAARGSKAKLFAGWSVRNRNVAARSTAAIDDCLVNSQNWGLGYSWLRYNGMFTTVISTGLTPIDRETVEIRSASSASATAAARRARARAQGLHGRPSPRRSSRTSRSGRTSATAPSRCSCDGDGRSREFRRWAASSTPGSEAATDSRSRTTHDCRRRAASRAASFCALASTAAIASALGCAPQQVPIAATATDPFDHESDVVVVGGGVIGGCAALFATHAGARDRHPREGGGFGGTAAKSAGVYWMPNNPFVRRRSSSEPSRESTLRALRALLVSAALRSQVERPSVCRRTSTS